MRFLLLAALCLFTTPVKAATYAVPNNASLAVYGDFTIYGGVIPASFSYQYDPVVFYNYYNVTNPSNLPGSVVINIKMNQAQVLEIYCNAFDAHCGRNNRYSTTFGISEVMEDMGVINISSYVNVIGAEPIDLHLFVNLPAGFSLTAPVAAVPEPSTWAMLLLGFAGIGLVSYRRRTNTTQRHSTAAT